MAIQKGKKASYGEKLILARLHFAKAVLAFHGSGCTDAALAKKLAKRERAYLMAKLGPVQAKLQQVKALANATPKGRA